MEFQKQVLDEIKKVDEHINTLEAKADEQAKLNGEVTEELKTELTKSQEAYTKLKERLDTIETGVNRIGESDESQKSFAQGLVESIKENHEQIMAFKSGSRPSAQISVKQPVTMTQGSSLSGEVVAPTRVPGFIHEADRQTHVRQYLQTATTDSNLIRFVREENYEDGTAITGEGAEKPKSSFGLEAVDAPVVKIATHFKVSEEMLEDVAGLSGYISTRGTTKYRLAEDNQLLYGTGASGQLEGLTVAAADFSSVLDGPITNLYDVALDAQAQLAARNYMASGIMLNPVDWFNLLTQKGSSGHYIVSDLIRQGLAPAQLNGVPVNLNTAVAQGDFFAANFAQIATLFDRTGVNVRFYEQNEDDAINNLVTVVIEGRLALPIYLPNAGVYGQLGDIITDPGSGGGGDG